MSFHHDSSTGKKKILPTELGTKVRTCTGKKIGTVSAVSKSGEFQVSLTAEGSAYLRGDENAQSMESARRYLPEDVEMVTEEAVWLRR